MSSNVINAMTRDKNDVRKDKLKNSYCSRTKRGMIFQSLLLLGSSASAIWRKKHNASVRDDFVHYSNTAEAVCSPVLLCGGSSKPTAYDVKLFMWFC